MREVTTGELYEMLHQLSSQLEDTRSKLYDVEHDVRAISRQLDSHDNDIYGLEQRVRNAESDISNLERNTK